MTIECMRKRLLLSREQSTCIKAIAITCVVICHVLNNYTRIFTPLGGIGVCIFLILSGYGLSVSIDSRGIKGYWKKRIISVWIPYMFLETVIVFIKEGRVINFGYLLDISLIQPKFVLGWYLNYIFICYTYFYFIERFIKSFRTKMMLYGVISLILLGYTFYIKDGLKFEQSFSFLIGIVLARCDVSKLIKNKIVWLNLCLGVFLLSVKQISFIREIQVCYYFLDFFLKTFISIGIIIFVLVNWKFYEGLKIKKALVHVGKSSYIIYLVHGYLLILFVKLKGYANIFIIATFCVCCFVATVVYYYFITFIQKIIARETD